MKKPMGFDLLKKQVVNAVFDDFEDMDSWVVGDSEIERLFHASFVFLIQYGRREFDRILTAMNPEIADQFRADYRDHLIVEHQVQLGDYRVDFVISAWTYGRVWQQGGAVEGNARWRKLVVECDGHDYHERTKEQAAKDRSRDRALNGMGYDVFRFTGSELWRDPWGCADQAYDWVIRGFG